MTKEQYVSWQVFFSQNRIARRAASFFATQVVYVYILLPLLFVGSPQGRAFLILGAVASLFGKFVVAKVLAFLFPSRRPYQRWGFVPVGGIGLFSRLTSTPDSFPSSHMTAMAAYAGLLLQFSVLLGTVCILLALVSGVCRVLLGFHYRKDMIAGVLLGFAIAYGMAMAQIVRLVTYNLPGV